MTESFNDLPDTPHSPRRWKGTLAGLVIGLILGGAATGLVLRSRTAKAPAEAGKPKAYQCPMHPQIIQDHEGDCPICGMDLVVMEGTQALQSPGPEGLVTVQIDPQRQQLMGLRTAKAEEGHLGGGLRAPGRVVIDETRLSRITVKLEGYVERLQADFTGHPVTKGQPLFELYSPEFLNAQREYLIALRTQRAFKGTEQEARWRELADSTRRRLEFLDVPAALIDTLERSGEVVRRLPVLAPMSGLVTQRNITQGSRISPADTALEIADLSRVWVLADLFEADLGRVKVGMGAELEIASLGKKLQGRVIFLDPVLDPKTRTLKARLEFPNPGGLLRPEMLGDVTFQIPERKALTVPLDAVLDSGTRKIVFVDVSQGHFEPREVTTGQQSADRVEILEGLEKGESVVTRAAFLVDSESRLQNALAEMTRRKSEATPGHRH